MMVQRTIAVFLVAVMLLVVAFASACGSRQRTSPVGQTPENGLPAPSPDSTDSPGLSAIKDATGAPLGVRIRWNRMDDATIEGYYIYRDAQPLSPPPDPAKRVNNGELIPQAPADTPVMSFDDNFNPLVGETFYYRMTAVDYDGDEGAYSGQRSITIGGFSLRDFSPKQGPVGTRVHLDGDYFGTYNPATDHVYFSGVVDDKAPSALYPGMVEAVIDPSDWTEQMIWVSVPLGATVGPITLVVGGSSVDTADDFNCTSPYITSVTPDPVTSGETLSIDGNNLGSHQLENRLLLNGVPYATITSWNSTHVTATVPTGIDPGLYKVQLRVKHPLTLEDTNAAWIDIIGLPPTPQIDKVSPQYGTPGSTDITVTGSNFGSDPSVAELRINNAILGQAEFTSYTDTEIRFTLPSSVTRTGETQLIIHAAEDVPSNLYRYTANISGGAVTPNGIAAGFDLGKYSATDYDSTGKLYVLFTDNTANNFNRSLFMAQRVGQVSFSFEALDPAYDAQDYYVSMAIDPFDNIHIAYQRQLNSASTDKVVRYGFFDGSTWSFETVYSAAGEVAGDYVDLGVYYDITNGIERYIAWRNATTGKVQVAYKMPSDTSWTIADAYTPRSASDQIGVHLAVDVADFGGTAFGPPKQGSALANGELGISWARYDSASGQYYIDHGYSWDLTNFYVSEADGPYSEVKETDIEYDESGYAVTLMWVTNDTVYWSWDYSTETVLSDTVPIGNGSRLKMSASYQPQIFGHRSGNQFYYAYRDLQGTWQVTNVPVGNSHSLDASGRWDMAYDTVNDYFALSHYDGTYRDARVFIREGASNFNVPLGDFFAQPGSDLTNQSLVVGSDGRPRIVFTDADTTTGEKYLLFGKFVGGSGNPPAGPPFSENSQWEFMSVDSTSLDLLGRATMALDGQERYNIAYLKNFQWSDQQGTHDERWIYFSRGDINGFSQPAQVLNVGLTNTLVPQISMGPSDDLAYILQYIPDDSQLVLSYSDDGFQTMQVQIVVTEPSITEYDVAMHHNEGSAVVAYYSPISNAIVLKDYADGSTTLLPGTSGLDTGLSLTLDDDEYASIVSVDLSGTGEAKWVHWDAGSGGYVVDTLAPNASPSLTTSQARTANGPLATYYNSSTGNHSLLLSFLDGTGQWNELSVVELFGATQQLRHSVDAYSDWWFVVALNGGSDYANNLVVLDVSGG